MSNRQIIFQKECIRCGQRAGTGSYRSAFEHSGEALFLISREKTIIEANPILARISQYSRQELASMPFDTLFPKVSDHQFLLSADRLTCDCPLFTFETTLKTKNRLEIPVEIAVSPLPGMGGPVFQAYARDISRTGQKAALSTLATPSAAAGIGISRSTPGPEGRYIKVNPAMPLILGYALSDFLDLNIFRLCRDPDAADTLARDMDRKGEVWERELMLTHCRGHGVKAFYTAATVKSPDSDTLFVDEIIYTPGAESIHDATCRISDRLRSIGALAGGIAHNFNNIMTGIYGNITLARMELPETSSAASHLQKAEDSMEEAVKLTRQLLTFAKGGDPIKETFDPGALIKDTAAFNLSGSPVRLDIDMPATLWAIHADKDQIGQVISNIVINARQAMKDSGVLSIHIENTTLLKDNLLTIGRGAYLKIVFKDQGTGIHQTNLDRIFDPYFTTKTDGKGMGLSICYSIVNKHKGHISAVSQLGTGTIVTVYLPAVLPESPKEDDVTTPDSTPKPQARILVMDDEDHIRNITKKMLEKFGYTVDMTMDGKAAVEQYKKAAGQGTPYDLVIMDLTIPGGMGGKEASREILDMDPDAKIAVSSGYSNDPVMADHKAYGLKGIIPKPYRLTELKETIQNLLAS
ncbi:MAG: ATP-binding protein [Desulfobacter sp.]